MEDDLLRLPGAVAEQLALITQLRDRALRSVTGWLDRETAWLASVSSRPALADPVQANVPILTIALDTGFQSLAPFNRAFKTTAGMTPREYRRAHLTRREAGFAT